MVNSVPLFLKVRASKKFPTLLLLATSSTEVTLVEKTGLKPGSTRSYVRYIGTLQSVDTVVFRYRLNAVYTVAQLFFCRSDHENREYIRETVD